MRAFLEFAGRGHIEDFVRQIDSGPFVQIKLVNHCHDAVEAHLQAQPIKVTVAGFCNGCLEVGRAVITHAAGEFVSNLNAAATKKI